MAITGWGAFWLFVSLVFCVDSWLYWKGHDTIIYSHRTPEEVAHQRKQLGLDGNECWRKPTNVQ